jgi:hypothetical protein
MGAKAFTETLLSKDAAGNIILHFMPHLCRAKTSSSLHPHQTRSDADILRQFLPDRFHNFTDVFSAEQARDLPPYWPHDHGIDLEPGAKWPWGLIYNMSGMKLTALWEFLDDMLKKGFVQASNFPAGMPILFVKNSCISVSITRLSIGSLELLSLAPDQ